MVGQSFLKTRLIETKHPFGPHQTPAYPAESTSFKSPYSQLSTEVMAPEPFRLTAEEVLQAYKSDTLTVEGYARSLLNRIAERDPVVKAWAHINPSQVIEQAKSLDRLPKDQRGPLHGVAVAIKDVIFTKGLPSIA